MIEDYKVKFPGEAKLLWCSVLGDWIPADMAKAAHLFSWKHGQETMNMIFGKTNPPEQIFSSRNGLIISKYIEAESDRGRFAIVPYLDDDPEDSVLCQWIHLPVREYQV
jgi:hypothetical protein